MTSPQPFSSTLTPLCLAISCNSPFKGYMTSGLGANTTSGLSPVVKAFARELDKARTESDSETPKPRTGGSDSDG